MAGSVSYYFLALATHLSWGLYHPLVRYLQNVSGLQAFYLLGGAHALSGAINLFSIFRTWLAEQRTNAAAAGAAVSVRVEDISRRSSRKMVASSSTSEDPVPIEIADSANVRPMLVLVENWRKPIVGIVYGLLTLLRAVTNIWSASLTLAYYVQAVSLLNPYVVAVFSFVFLNEKTLPRGFFLACTLCAVGAFLVLAGQNITEHDRKRLLELQRPATGHSDPSAAVSPLAKFFSPSHWSHRVSALLSDPNKPTTIFVGVALQLFSIFCSARVRGPAMRQLPWGCIYSEP